MLSRSLLLRSFIFCVRPKHTPNPPPLAPNSVFGVAAGLFNNLWNTNYPLWYPYYDPAYCADGPLSCSNQNQLFRFELAFTAR